MRLNSFFPLQSRENLPALMMEPKILEGRSAKSPLGVTARWTFPLPASLAMSNVVIQPCRA